MKESPVSVIRLHGLMAVITVLMVFFTFCQPLFAADYYVSPGGDDGNAGTLQSPFATIQHARDVVRTRIAGGMTEDITVHLGAGNYFIDTPVVFDDQDAGRNGHTIIYQGAPNLGARIYGGRRITGWTPVNDTEYAVTVPDLQQHYTLYENDEAANGGIFHIFADAPAGNWRKNGTQLIYHPRTLPIADQVVVLGTTKDVFVVKGRSNQQIVSNLVFDGLHMIGSDFAGSEPGGVTGFDGWTGTYDGASYNGHPMGVIFPEARHGQFFIENAQNITIRNSKLYGAGFMAVFVHRWAQHNRVENCWIENAGCSGMYFQGWECGRGGSEGITTLAASYCNKFNVVRNNVFHDIGRFQHDAAGIYLCWSGDNTVEHNVFNGITRYGVATKGWRPKMINNLFYWVFNPRQDGQDGQLFAYDQSHIIYYDGYIVTQANQGEELNHSRNNLIRYNDFSQIARSGDDMGMIETWGAGDGNVWEYNSLHDGVNTAGWDNSWMHCLFNDDGTHGSTLRGNIMYWIAGGGMSQAIMAKGNGQNNSHNIIVDCELSAAATIGPFVEEAHNMAWSRNIVASKIDTISDGGYGTETAGGVTYPILQAAEKNLYFYKPIDPGESSAAGAANIQQQVAIRNQSGGIDSDAIYADPLFDRQNPWWDAKYTDYRLQAGSPAHALGFVETNMGLIGLQDGFPFDLTIILGSPAHRIRMAADYSRIFKNRITNQQVRSRDGSPLHNDSWTRYSDVDFSAGQYDQFLAHLEWVSNPQDTGTAIEIRVNAPDGQLIGTLPYGQNSCYITPTSGLHDVFMVFPGENVQAMNWFTFEPRLVWNGNGSDDHWTTAENWTIPAVAGNALYFGASARTTPNNDFPAGTGFAGITFDVGAPAFSLGGNAIILTGDLVNNSDNDQTITLPITLPGTGQIHIDTGARSMTLGGALGGSGDGLTKTGTGTLTLGSISHTGDFTVEGGALVLTKRGLFPMSTLTIGATNGAEARLDLRHGFTERVFRLFIDGVQMPDGTYGSSSSAATHKDDTVFGGSGILLVQSGPTPPILSTRADGYTIATFALAGSGTWTIPAGVTQMEVLVVGGGGGGAAGGTWSADGGGGGGLTYHSTYNVTSGNSVSVTVGAGGAARTSYGNGNPGNASSFGALTAAGGEGGLSTRGGNSGGRNLNGIITAGGLGATHDGSNGGGGADQNGSGAHGDSPGGNGYPVAITGTSTYYAGGGGGGYSGGNNAGGLGGGGKGADEGSGFGHAGQDGLGGGGGASRDHVNSGAGGSGVVIVAYQTPATPYDMWAGSTGFNLSGGQNGDDDGDGLSNFHEFAFGLNPTRGTSNNPITGQLDKITKKFRYTRLANSGLNYTVETSTALQSWAIPDNAPQTVVATVDGIQTVEVELISPTPGDHVFVRVKAQ